MEVWVEQAEFEKKIKLRVKSPKERYLYNIQRTTLKWNAVWTSMYMWSKITAEIGGDKCKKVYAYIDDQNSHFFQYAYPLLCNFTIFLDIGGV